jgi:hypothetical protein
MFRTEDEETPGEKRQMPRRLERRQHDRHGIAKDRPHASSPDHRVAMAMRGRGGCAGLSLP